ncbi:MAG: RNA 2',3'-cyclic phosphodiesterase [Pirellulales bacterium]|nr:RNA 2',3'-cyclic phosphodiesterase [Pirellulales bacterium]
MKQKFRTFVAVKLGPAVCSKAAEIIRALQAAPADVKWVDPDNLHLTLKFLGDVEAAEIHRVCETVQQAVADSSRFEFEVRGLGAFPAVKRPRTIWLGAGEGERQMVDLAKALEKKLQKLGFPREGRRFQPHVTIGRLRHGGRAGEDLADLLLRQAEVHVGTAPVEEVTVFSSTLTPSGPIYDVLSRAALATA